MSISVMLASHFSPQINGFLRKNRVLDSNRYPLLLLALVLLHFVIGLLPSLFSILFMALAASIAAINETMIITDLHNRVDSSNRATMESVYSMIERTLVVLLGLVFGWVSDLVHVFGGFTALGLALLMVLIVTQMMFRRGPKVLKS